MAALLGGVQRLLLLNQPSLRANYFCKNFYLLSNISSSDSESVKRCKGINYMKNGDDPPLLPDSEYPDWLWKLADPKKALEDLPKDSKSYWRRLSKVKRRQENMARKQKRF